MKFGLEAEKFIFNMKTGAPSESVFCLLDALSDFDRNLYHSFGDNKATNEFVLNMIEFGTTPSVNPLDVLKDYLFNYLMIKNVAAREQVALAPLAALPMEYLPHMTPKRAYYIQNSILSGKKQQDWVMDTNSPLKAAGNCAGIHAHAQIETRPEFLYSNDELKDKFNMGLMMTPMIAFSSSPYFFSKHEGKSMRGLRYYQDVYRNFPLNGGLPPVMNSSVEVLEFGMHSGNHWISEGTKLGFFKEELELQVQQKSANWNPVRWNSRWNTIEIRCLESDSFELDAAKFIWVCGAMKRMDLQGEGLKGVVLKGPNKLDLGLVRECLEVSGKEVSILPTPALKELFQLAMVSGTENELVEEYLHRLSAFSQKELSEEETWIFKKLQRVLDTHETTADLILRQSNKKSTISDHEASELVIEAIARNDKSLASLQNQAPEILQLLKVATRQDSFSL